MDSTLTNEALDELELRIETLSAGARDVAGAEALLSSIAEPLLRANGYAAESLRLGDAQVDLVATDVSGNSIGVEFKCRPHSLVPQDLAQILAAAETRLHRHYLLMTNCRLRPETMALARQAADRAVSILTLDNLRGWIASVRHRAVRPGGAAELVRRLSRDLIQLIARDDRELFAIEWRDLERTIAEAFDGLGFKVTLTPPAKDGGKDIILECSENGSKRSYVVEIKHWVSGKHVGGSHVRKFVSVVLNEKHSSGLFLSTSGFAGNAFESLSESQIQRLRVAGKEKMVAICKTYVKAQTGLWLANQEPADLLFCDTDAPGTDP